MQGTRDYNVGEGPDVSVQAVAQQMGLSLDPDFKARQVNPEQDIVHFDVVLVMDKYTAADLLREVSTFVGFRCSISSLHYAAVPNKCTQTFNLTLGLMISFSLQDLLCVHQVSSVLHNVSRNHHYRNHYNDAMYEHLSLVLFIQRQSSCADQCV